MYASLGARVTWWITTSDDILQREAIEPWRTKVDLHRGRDRRAICNYIYSNFAAGVSFHCTSALSAREKLPEYSEHR